jgi:hypothetical protein
MKNAKNIFVGIATPLLLLLLSQSSVASVSNKPNEPREIQISATRSELSPKTINVTKGERVRLLITSNELARSFSINGLEINKTVGANETESIDLSADREGRFQIRCVAKSGVESGELSGELVVAATAEISAMKVIFDPNNRDVVIVESGGERLRIDTSSKTVERVIASTNDVTPTITSANQPISNAINSTSQQTAPATTREQESTKVSEPYDYHIVNIPTPKAVRRHSLNLSFTHRFQEPITSLEMEKGDEHIARISKDLLGLDSSSVSSFGVTYGITDRLYANVYRSPICQPGLCKTIELGLGYHLLDEAGKSPVALSAYASVEGDYNFTERYTYNFQAMIGRSITKFANVFFSPAVHINSNGSDRFKEFLSSQPLISELRLGRHSGSFGFGVNGRIRPTTSLLFEYTPRVGFKMGQIIPDFDTGTGQLVGFKNDSEAEIGFGIEKRIGRHVFSLTFSNTQATTTARYNSSNQAFPPSRFSIGFNLYRRLL